MSETRLRPAPSIWRKRIQMTRNRCLVGFALPLGAACLLIGSLPAQSQQGSAQSGQQGSQQPGQTSPPPALKPPPPAQPSQQAPPQNQQPGQKAQNPATTASQHGDSDTRSYIRVHTEVVVVPV